MKMKNELIKYKTALLAKKKGFPQNISYDFYLEDGKTMTDKYYISKLHKDLNNNLTASPTQALLQKWLREKHNIHIEIIWDVNYTIYYFGSISIIGSLNNSIDMPRGIHKTYEEALEKALQEALKLI